MFDELYQEIILDHNRKPRNRHKLECASHSAEGYNPLCGDQVKVYLKMDGETITDIAFEGNGCAISTASASLMTETLKGKTLPEVETMFKCFHSMVKGQELPEGLGKLAAFSGLSDYPMRVKCATLCWHAVQAAVSGHQEVTTEK